MRSAVVQKFDRVGNWQMEFGGYANHDQLGRLGVIGGIATDRNNHVYVLDSENDRVQVFRSDNGAWLGAFGAKGSGTGHFNLGDNAGSGGIAIFQPTPADDPLVYIADQNNDRVQKILLDQLADDDPAAPLLPGGTRSSSNHSYVPRADIVTTWGIEGSCYRDRLRRTRRPGPDGPPGQA